MQGGLGAGKLGRKYVEKLLNCGFFQLPAYACLPRHRHGFKDDGGSDFRHKTPPANAFSHLHFVICLLSSVFWLLSSALWLLSSALCFPSSQIVRRQAFDAFFGDQHGLLKLGGQGSVFRDGRPVIIQYP